MTGIDPSDRTAIITASRGIGPAAAHAVDASAAQRRIDLTLDK